MTMTLEILLPFQVFSTTHGVARIVAETAQGSFGLLPHRLDCVMALPPGILLFEAGDQAEVCVAVDAGVLVKTGANVRVSVRRALGGTDLVHLHHTVQHEFLVESDDDRSLRAVMAELEAGFLRRLGSLGHG